MYLSDSFHSLFWKLLKGKSIKITHAISGIYIPSYNRNAHHLEFFTFLWRGPCMVHTHSASLGRFVPHHASAVWRKVPLHRTIFRLNLEKMAAPISMLTIQRLTGVIFIIHCSYLVIPKLYFIEIEVNSLKRKIGTVLKWRHL